MNKEQQRIAIAEVCGWRFVEKGKNARFSSHVFHGVPPNKEATDHNEEPIPDYLNDLNAMNDAEKILKEQKQKTEYVGYLMSKTSWSAFASASQRAEAFLRTLNLWTES